MIFPLTRSHEDDESVQTSLTIFDEIVDLAFRSAFHEYQIISVLTRACMFVLKSDRPYIRDKVNDIPCPRWLTGCAPRKLTEV